MKKIYSAFISSNFQSLIDERKSVINTLLDFRILPIDDSKTETLFKDKIKSSSFEGEFHDEAPSPKHGRIFLFKNAIDRNNFLLENRKHVIKEV